MSLIVASGDAISNHLLNHSQSKQMYSFGRATRFPEIKRSASSSTFFYNIPDKMSKRKTFIGYGNKSDFTKFKDTNAPFYQVKRMFENRDDGTPKYSFGLGRSYFQKTVVGNSVSNVDSISPGPAKYNYLRPFGSFSPKYTMPKNKVLFAGEGYVDSPGPAKYTNNLIINDLGKYTLSKFKNSPRNGWSLSRSQRFKYNCKNI